MSTPDASEQRPRSAGGLLAASGAGTHEAGSAYAAPRGLRFPSSRRYLWDRTPAGAQVLVSTQVRLA